MKVIEFAFDERDTGNASDYLPHNYPENCVVYTGTHDNETLIVLVPGYYAQRAQTGKRVSEITSTVQTEEICRGSDLSCYEKCGKALCNSHAGLSVSGQFRPDEPAFHTGK